MAIFVQSQPNVKSQDGKIQYCLRSGSNHAWVLLMTHRVHSILGLLGLSLSNLDDLNHFRVTNSQKKVKNQEALLISYTFQVNVLFNFGLPIFMTTGEETD